MPKLGQIICRATPPRCHLQLLHRPNVFKDAPKIRLRRKAHRSIGIWEAQPASPVSAYYEANSRKRRAVGGLSALARSLNAIRLPPTDASVAHPTWPPLRHMATRRRMSSTGSLLFDAVLMSTRCRIERCCATPFLFWPGDWQLDPKTEPVPSQNFIHRKNLGDFRPQGAGNH
jgi:hypothetical protein